MNDTETRTISPPHRPPRNAGNPQTNHTVLRSVTPYFQLTINSGLDTMKPLHESLEFSQEQLTKLAKENKSLQHCATSLTTQLDSVDKENKDIKETILDLQSRSMRDNLVFSSIPERTHDDNPEQLIKEFMTSHLQISPDIVNNITFHQVHHIGAQNANKHPQHPETTGTTSQQTTESYGLWTNDQFP